MITPTLIFFATITMTVIVPAILMARFAQEEELIKRGATYRWNHPRYMAQLHKDQTPLELPAEPEEIEAERPLSWLEIIARFFALAATLAVVAFLVFGFA